MPNREFLYFVTSEDGRSYHETNGVIDSSSQPKPLTQTPDGWQEVAVAWERNISDVGTVRNFSSPLNFIRTGRKILLSIFFNKNIEEKVYLLIKKLTLDFTLTTYHYIYRYFYRGALDFSTLKDDGSKATISIMENGIMQAFKAHRNTVYEIPFKDEALIKMDGIILQGEARYMIPPTAALNTELLVPVVFLNNELKAPNVVHQNSDSADKRFVYNHTSTTPIQVRLKGELKFQVNARTQKIRIVLFKSKVQSDPTPVGTAVVQDNIFDPVGRSVVTVSYDLTTTLDKEEGLYIEARPTGPSSSTSHPDLSLEETYLTVTYTSRYPTTYVKALTPSQILTALTKHITGRGADCDTSFLDQYAHLMITSGDAIRGVNETKDSIGNIIIKAPVIKTSLNQFFEFCKTVLAAGIGIENNKISIQPYDHFLDYSNPIDLGEVREFSWSYANDLIANTVKIGYPDQNISDVNGKHEFNNTHLYAMPQSRVIRETNYTSPYLAQPYLIESRRANLDQKKSTDNQQDNDIFVINVNTSALETYTATKNILETVALGHPIRYNSAPANSFFVPNASLTEFTYRGNGQSISVSATVSARANATLQIFRNSDMVASATLIAQAGTTGTPSTSVLVNDGDVIKVVLDGSGTVNINSSSLIIQYTGGFTLRRAAYDKIAGIPEVSHATIFNIEDLTPKRLLLKQRQWINSIAWGFDAQQVKYNTTEKNAELYTERGNTYVDEDGTMSITADRLFIPIYFEFETPVPTDLVDSLETDPNRCFRFTVEGKTFKGFLMKAGLAAATEQQQTFKLLATPDNSIEDLKQLIDG